MKWLSLIWVFFLSTPPAFSDTSMKAKIFLAGETQSWLSGQKRRMEVQVPVVGKIVTITRVDRGVEWILNPDKKIYQERPIALPYNPQESTEPQSGGGSNSFQNQDQDSENVSETPKDCVPELLRVPGNKVIAGYTVTGFSLSCGKGKPVQAMIWMAPPLGNLDAVSKEWASYYHSHAAALYANFPPGEKAELISSTAKFGDALKNLFLSKLGNSVKFPEGVIMAVEGKFNDSGKGPSKTVYEVREISSAPVDPAFFEIPAGYQKVPDITKAILQSSFQNFQQLIQTAKKFFVQSGMTGAATQSNPFQAAVEWAKKTYRDFMASQNKK